MKPICRTLFSWYWYLELTLLEENDDVSEDVMQELKRILGRKVHAKAVQVGPQIYLLGSVKTRVPSRVEAEVLAKGHIAVGNFATYERLMISGTVYQTKSSVKGLSDKSVVFTRENTFCSIENFVLLAHNGTDICGAFVTEHDVLPRPFREAHHIAQVQSMTAGLPHFIRVELLKCPVVQKCVQEISMVVPMPNLDEID